MAAAEQVDIFADDYVALSNFTGGYGFWADAEFGNVPRKSLWWPSAEHYLQAGKFADPALQERIRSATDASEAKGLGRRLSPLRPDWNGMRRARVRRAMLEKLWAHKAPREVLLATGDAELVNGNPQDPFFGVGPDGRGENAIGTELADLRAFFRRYTARRLILLRVAGLGDPFEPRTLRIDITGLAPEAVSRAAAEALQIKAEVLESVEFVTEGGFEKTSVEEFADASGVEAFLLNNADDCALEVRLQDEAPVTLWDASQDRHLARTDVAHLANSITALRARLELSAPLLGYDGFQGRVMCTINDEVDEAFEVNSSSFSLVVAAAAAGEDVVVAAEYTIPATPQPPLRRAPSDMGFSQVRCGDHTALSQPELVDRIRGIIWGAALGDSVGLATEFMTKQQAASTYPDRSALSPVVRCMDKHRSRWSQGDWTDDTDQCVLLLDAIVASKGVLDQLAFAESLVKWKSGGFPELGDSCGLGIGQTVHAVLEHEAFLVAPDVAAQDVWLQTGCSQAANGAIMRCAASGLAYFWDEEIVAFNAAAGAACTHADPRCVASCVVVAWLISRALLGVDMSSASRRQDEVQVAVHSAIQHLDGGDADELRRSAEVPAGGLGDLQLGAGGIGYTMKSLGAGCWAFLHAENFRDAIAEITMEAGDADSNAVVAGALLGARFGYSGLPKQWLDDLPALQTNWLDRKVQNLLELMGLQA